MIGRIVCDVAQLVSDTANERIAQEVGEEANSGIHLRSGLLLALVSNEADRGTTKEELVVYLERIYDLVNNPSCPPPKSH